MGTVPIAAVVRTCRGWWTRGDPAHRTDVMDASAVKILVLDPELREVHGVCDGGCLLRSCGHPCDGTAVILIWRKMAKSGVRPSMVLPRWRSYFPSCCSSPWLLPSVLL